MVVGEANCIKTQELYTTYCTPLMKRPYAYLSEL